MTIAENSADRIIVNDITGAPGGQVLMESDNITDIGDPSASDKRALFHFSDTFGGVTILNKSTKDLYLRNISLAGGSNPWVDLRASIVSLTFDLRRSPVPTLINIANVNPLAGAEAPDIILTGTIENPIGQTIISALTGDIVSYADRDQPRRHGRDQPHLPGPHPRPHPGRSAGNHRLRQGRERQRRQRGRSESH